MRRFESTPGVWMGTPSGPKLGVWVAEGRALRLAGLAGLGNLPPARGLLLPRCRAVHTVGMRFALDLVFISWPPERGASTVLATTAAVPPFRMVTGPRRPRARIAVLEARAGTLARAGLRAGARVALVPALLTSWHGGAPR
jgi:uncharacterized membrane protein (UPF0127 family)